MGAALQEIGENLCDTEDDFIKYQLQKSQNQLIRNTPQNNSIRHQGLQYIANWTNETQKTGDGVIFVRKRIGMKGYYYEGKIFKGKAQGRGKLYMYQDVGGEPESYVGLFEDNCAHVDSGEQKGVYENRAIKFEGKWENGKPVKGRLTLKQTNDTFKVNSLNLNELQKYTQGYINVDFQNSYHYSGNIAKKGNVFVYDGHGTMKFNKGSKHEEQYSGNWENGQMEGYGEYKWPNGIRYEGQYHRGLKHGHGKYYIGNQRYYEGQWKDGQKNGFFEIRDVLTNEIQYENEFRNDLPVTFDEN